MAEARTVADIMTADVITLRAEDNLSSLSDEMSVYGMRHLPVVDGGRLVGLVSHRDLLAHTASVLHADALHRAIDEREKAGTFVATIMTRDVVTVRPDSPLDEAAEKLAIHRFGCLPVTSEDGKLVGIVTEADFMALLVRMLRASKAPK